MVALHLKKHGGDAEKSLAAVPAGRSIRDGLADLGDPDIEASLGHLGSARPTHLDERRPDRTASLSVGPPPPTASGSASSGPTPGAAWGPSSWPSTRN